MPSFTDAELIAFLDEELAAVRSSALEDALRHDESLRNRLAALRGQNLAGLHTLGAIWRRERLTCASRDVLAAFLRNELPAEEDELIRFHITDIGCRVCMANLEDLQSQKADSQSSRARRDRVFKSSAGHLRS